MTRMMSRLRRANDPEQGFALITVIGFVAVITSLMLLGGVMADRSLVSSTQHSSFEGALAAAEDGIDKGLARGKKAYQVGGSDSWFSPAAATSFDAAPECTAASVAWPFASAPAASQERTWAKTQMLALIGTTGCLRHAPQGDYVVLKPTGHQAIYAMGWSPRFGAREVQSRLVKAEYIFAPYSPSNAILTGGDLELGSSTTVSTAGQACPGSGGPYLAGVHTNGALTVNTGNPTVCGPVSASTDSTGQSSNNFYDPTNTSGTIATSVRQSVTVATAAQVWGINHATNPPGGWYDLCANGQVRAPDGATPCSGTLLYNVSAGGSYRGWSFSATSPPTWSAGDALMQNGYSGTYYIDGGNVVTNASNSGSAVPNLTVIAASSSPNCAKVGGNITWNHIDIAAPSLHSTFLFADQDLLTQSNWTAGSRTGGTVVSGLFIAGDQTQMETSSAGAYGAVIAQDVCDPPDGTTLVDKDVIKNPTIYYDPNAQAPFIDLINTTLWLEYPSG